MSTAKDKAIYLDNAATTPLWPEVADATHEAALRFSANPASQHEQGRAARRRLEQARDEIGQLLGAQTTGMNTDRVIFTSGGTEAANLAILGLNRSDEAACATGIVISAIEHPCVSAAAAHLEAQRKHVKEPGVLRLPANTEGVVSPKPLEALEPATTRLVSLMLANNETGIVQPVAEAARLCQAAQVPLHTDATQAVGKVPVNFQKLGVTALSCAAHKFHGPLGVGVLVVRQGVPLKATLLGGHQQAGLRPGTESVALAVGMATALRIASTSLAENQTRLESLRDRFESALRERCPEVFVIGNGVERLAHISNLAFAGVDRQAMTMALDLAGVACSTGSACASGSSEPSPTLLAMGLPEGLISGSLRFSFSAMTTTAEIDEATRRILKCYNSLRQPI